MISVSACMIVYNEEEMLPYSLEFLRSMPVKEIVIVDSFSTDGTVSILEKAAAEDSRVKWSQKEFKSFGAQRNTALDLSTQDWILYIDADETYTPQLGELFKFLSLQPEYRFVRIPTLVSISDMKHVIDSGNSDPHVRLWRRGPRHSGDVHEVLVDDEGQDIHCLRSAEVFETWTNPETRNVWMKHHQLLKSHSSLLMKGERWDGLGLLEKSSQAGIPVGKTTWSEWKKHSGYHIRELSKDLWDVTTEKYHARE